MGDSAGGVVDLSTLNYVRTGHDYLRSSRPNYKTEDLDLLNGYLNFVLQEAKKPHTKFKVGLMFVCINYPYWQYLRPVIDGVKNMFLPGHDVEIMLWSDLQNLPENKDVNYGATVFPTDSIEWPYPTLMRYQYFLAQKEYLKKFDYIFYLDLDMRIVNVVGDEVLGEGLTVAPHPGYYVRKEVIPPYEPNKESEAYINRPGAVMDDNGKPRFFPYYCAGGFQGGKTDLFIDAMETMQKGISKDLSNGYIAVWNDESHWNKYVFDVQDSIPITRLDPSYVYPDSMIQEYYVPKVWGRDFNPRIITITKPFSLSKDGGKAAQELMK